MNLDLFMVFKRTFPEGVLVGEHGGKVGGPDHEYSAVGLDSGITDIEDDIVELIKVFTLIH